MKRIPLLPSLCLTALVASICFLVACDDSSSSTSSFFLTPPSITLSDDDTAAVFTVGGSGSSPISWSVSDTNLGSVAGGDLIGTYTRAAGIVGANEIIATDANGNTASATVFQNAELPTLVISPVSTSVSSNGVQVFSAEGGSGIYSWFIASGSGVVSPASGDSTVYTSTDGATDVVGLSDGNTTVFATVGKN